MACPSCGAAVPGGALFCPSCGHSLRVRTDERRVVTVVFADIVGFTGLSESRDPETVKNLIDRCFARLGADVGTYGGRVDKVLGDGIMALFGAPTAHEDDAERAVRAALQMLRTVEAVAAEEDVNLRVRIGVNTGEVLVGSLVVGDDYTAMGDVVNAANRLQTAAEPGQVLVGPATWSATREVVRYEPRDAVQARNREEPIPAFIACEALLLPGRRPRRSRSPLVGREEELGTLRCAVSTAVARHKAHLILIIGEAGVGKSRLAEEIAEAAACDHGALVLEGRCLPYGEANVWWPIAEMLRHACSIGVDDDAAATYAKTLCAVAAALDADEHSVEVATVTDGLVYLLGDETALQDIEVPRARDQAVRSLLTYLEALAAQRPLVMLVAELHWADPLVLDLGEKVHERMRSLPVVLLCTTRPLEEGTPGPKFGRHNHVVMYLDPLDRLAAEGLVDHLLEATGDHAASELRELLIDRSGGNPLFLEELVALLSEEGRLDRSSLGELPATLRGLVAARLDALSPAERATVEDASVMGRPGPVLALRSLAEGRGVTDIDDTLRSLVEKELVVVDGDRCGVKSELVREVAYGTLTKAERARRHAAIARWLSDRTQATDREDEFLESLAHHYTLAAGLAAELGHVDGVPADIVERARITLTKAASRAEGRETWLVATHLYDHLLKLVPVGERRAALIGRARARAAVSRVDEAATDAHEAIAEAEAAGDNHSLAAALVALGVAERNGRNLDKSGQHLDRAVEMFRQLGAPAGIADALRHRSMTYIFQGNAGAGEAAAREALAAYRAAGDRRGEGWCLWNLAWTSFERADYDRADERLDDALALFTDTGDQGGAAWAVGLQAWVSYFRGDLVRSEALARSVFGTAVDNGEQWASGMMQVLLANVALWRGHLHEALDRARDAHRRFLPAHDGWGQFQASTPMVRALLGVGRPGDAFAALEDLRQQAATLPPALTAGLGNITACLYLMVGDGQRALAQTMAEDRPSGLMDIERRAITGLALLQCGRPDEAVAILEDAKTVATEIGSKALTLARLTLAYAAVGRTADALAARREFDELGAGTYTDRIEMLIATLLTYARDRRPAEMEAALAEATAAADGTEDSLLQALVRLAEAVARSALGSATPEHAREARQRLALAGIGPASPAGWEVAFALAAGVTPAEASAAAS